MNFITALHPILALSLSSYSGLLLWFSSVHYFTAPGHQEVTLRPHSFLVPLTCAVVFRSLPVRTTRAFTFLGLHPLLCLLSLSLARHGPLGGIHSYLGSEASQSVVRDSAF